MDEVEELRLKLEQMTQEEEDLNAQLGSDPDADLVHYVRLIVRETKDQTQMPAVSGLQLVRLDGTLAEFKDAWCNTWSSSIKPEHIIDGNPKTAWRDDKHKPVCFELTEPAVVIGYRMRNSPDNEGEDPKHWRLDGSTEKDGHWNVLHDMAQDACLPHDRSGWSVMIPIKPDTDKMVEAVVAGDKAEQEARYADIQKRKSLDLAATGPTQAEVDRLVKAAAEARLAAKADHAAAERKKGEIQSMKERTVRAAERKKIFTSKLGGTMADLLVLVDDFRQRTNAAEATEPEEGIAVVEEIQHEREKTLIKVQGEADTSKSEDGTLSASLTALQNKCVQALPRIEEEAERTTNGILIACQREITELEEAYRVLDAKNRELSFHTKRGTNYKQSWKVQRGHDKEIEDADADLRRREKDESTELDSEIRRLRRARLDMTGELKKMEKDFGDEQHKLKKSFNEVHKERSQLGQERCELEGVCADFSTVIERLREQYVIANGSSNNKLLTGGKKLIPPIPTKFTLGHGRISPRPHTSPRRSVSPRPSRGVTPRTPRVSITPRRLH
ncbi:hypothetical protein DIPPA_20250 [Diplonema papillatum]|nr:hypothetical protein DIPPA_20250 [Diplonema papillatum]